MRQIKFRVYNTKTKSWIHGPHVRPDMDGVNLFGECILLGGFMDTVSIEDLNNCVALQYTGIKDKDGHEIYEGDIIQLPESIGVVKWNDYQAGFFIDGQDKITYSILYTFNGENARLVVGNIFENPTLL